MKATARREEIASEQGSYEKAGKERKGRGVTEGGLLIFFLLSFSIG